MLEKIDVLLMHLAAYAGQVAEGMTRTHAWRFLDLGRRLERALQESQLIRGLLAEGGGSDPAALESLLEVSDSVMTYRSRLRQSRFQLGAGARPVDLATKPIRGSIALPAHAGGQCTSSPAAGRPRLAKSSIRAWPQSPKQRPSPRRSLLARDYEPAPTRLATAAERRRRTAARD